MNVVFQLLFVRQSPFSSLVLSGATHRRELTYYLGLYPSSFTGTAAPVTGGGGTLVEVP